MENETTTRGDKSQLIRQEALAHARLSQHGTVLLTNSRIVGIAAAAALAMSLCLVTLLTCASYTRQVTIHGHLHLTQKDFSAVLGVEGVVTRVRVMDGESVSIGAPLFDIETTSSSDSPVVITARHPGIVTGIASGVGQLIRAGAPLAMILPEGASLEGEAYVPASLIGKVREGMKVSIRYIALPYQTFGQFSGVITEITETPDAPMRPDTRLGQPVESIFCVHIRLDGRNANSLRDASGLRSGMPFDASVPLERRPLYQWFLPFLFKPSDRA